MHSRISPLAWALAFVLLMMGCRSEDLLPGAPPFGAGAATTGDTRLGVVVPHTFSLAAPYPNPFNPETAVSFDVPHESPVLIVAQNPLGDVVATLHSGILEAGYYRVDWDATAGGTSDLKGGLYFITMYAPGFTASRVVKYEP